MDEPRRRMLEILHDGRGTGDVPAAARQRLGERPHPEVNVAAIDAVMLADPAARPAHDAQRVRLVHQQERLVLPLQLDQPIQRREVAVHAGDALHRDQHPADLGTQRRQDALEGVHVVVRERPAAGAREPGAAEDAVVRQGVVDDQVLRAEQMAEHRDVRGVPAHQDDRVLAAQEPRQGGFQLAVDRPLAGRDPARRGRGPVANGRVRRGTGHFRVARESQIVLRREIEVVAAGDHRAVAADPLPDAEIRQREAPLAHLVEPTTQGPDLGEVLEPVSRRLDGLDLAPADHGDLAHRSTPRRAGSARGDGLPSARGDDGPIWTALVLVPFAL